MTVREAQHLWGKFPTCPEFPGQVENLPHGDAAESHTRYSVRSVERSAVVGAGSCKANGRSSVSQASPRRFTNRRKWRDRVSESCSFTTPTRALSAACHSSLA